MVDVALEVEKADGSRSPLQASDAGVLLVDTGLAPVLGAGLDVRLPQAQVDALRPLETQPVSGTVAVSNLPATQPVSGSVAVSNFPATQAVSGSVSVSGMVEVVNDVGNPLPVSGTVTALPSGTQTVAGTVELGSSSLAALEQTTVTVSNPGLTDAQLRATPVLISGSVTSQAAPDVTTSGSVQAAGSTVVLLAGSSGGLSAFSFDITGFTTGTFVIERTLNPNPASGGALWTPIGAFKAGTRTSRSTWTDSPGAYHGNMSASTAVRVRVTSALNAAATVNLLGGRGTGTITIGAIASNEGNEIGAVATLLQQRSSTFGGTVAFNATTDVLEFTGSNTDPGTFVAALSNPTGSGVDLYVHKVHLSCRNAGTWRRYRGGTLSLTTGQQPVAAVNRGAGTNTPSGQLFRRETVLTVSTTVAGGNVTRVDFLSDNDGMNDLIDGSLRIRPGDLIYWRFRAAANQTVQVSLEPVWHEEPAR